MRDGYENAFMGCDIRQEKRVLRTADVQCSSARGLSSRIRVMGRKSDWVGAMGKNRPRDCEEL